MEHSLTSGLGTRLVTGRGAFTGVYVTGPVPHALVVRGTTGKVGAMRHPWRFFPRLAGEERDLVRAAGCDWREVAQDRECWAARRSVWVDQQDLPWSSLGQLTLEF